MKRKLFALILALLLCIGTALSASADAYVEPPYSPPYDILQAHESNGRCSPLNTFLSNFVEVGMQHYDSSTPDSDVIAAVLKHLELNAKSFSGDMKKVDGDDGKTYMRISASLFERRMDRLFDRDIPASVCDGYEDGNILVSAAHYNGPIEVFASVYECTKYAEDEYQAKFDVYFVNEDFSGWYKTAHDNLPLNKLTKLGSGIAVVDYDGGETVDSISTSDFSLVSFSMDAEGIPCAGANLPYGVEETQPPETTEAPILIMPQPETQPQTQPQTEPEAPQITKPQFHSEEKDLDDPVEETGGFDFGISPLVLILIILLVISLSVVALVVILLVVRKKK